MVKRREQLFAELMLLSDVATLAASYFIAYWIRSRFLSAKYGALPPIADYAWLAWVIVPVCTVSMWKVGLYASTICNSASQMMKRVLTAQVLGAATLMSITYMMIRPEISRFVLGIFVAVSTIALIGEKFALKSAMDCRARRRRAKKLCQVLVVGDRAEAESYLQLLRDHPHWGVEVAKILSSHDKAKRISNGQQDGHTNLGQFPEAQSKDFSGEDIEDFFDGSYDWSQVLQNFVIDEVVAVSPWQSASGFARLQQACMQRGVTFRILVKMPPAEVGSYQIEDLGRGSYLVSLESVPQESIPLVAKRVIDILVSVPGLVLCGLVYLWYRRRVRRESPGPVFFGQQRVGQNGRRFRLWKFRTMCIDAEERQQILLGQSAMGGAFIKLERDPRVTPTGWWLRRLHLDELPQFWNVLKGEMSLVGPRPSQPVEVAQYDPSHYRRLSMKPGITGLFQVQGHGVVNGFDDVVKLDCEYIDKWSIRLDCTIIAKTITKVVRADGW